MRPTNHDDDDDDDGLLNRYIKADKHPERLSVYLLGLDQGPNCKGATRRVKAKVNPAANVAIAVIWCFSILYNYASAMYWHGWSTSNGKSTPRRNFQRVSTHCWRQLLTYGVQLESHDGCRGRLLGVLLATLLNLWRNYRADAFAPAGGPHSQLLSGS